jgi:hypothetical protein
MGYVNCTLVKPIIYEKREYKTFYASRCISAFLAIIVCDIGVGNSWWYFRETTYPLGLLSSYVYGLFPIIPMWILNYTYERFWLFVAVETVATLFSPSLFCIGLQAGE